MINRLFHNRYFLFAMQIITLIAFVLIILGGIGVTTDNADFAKVLRNTNLSNLIVWSYWWPFIIVTAILFGRYWCSICPVELVTSLFGRIGFRIKPGKLLKSGWIITLFYGVILILGIHTLAIHRVPQYMAIYLIVLFVVAILVGIVWEKRTFCTHVCPIGHLLGLYSLLSFSKLKVKSEDICAKCKTKDCISINNHYKTFARSCTSELYPPNISDSRECILCGQCFNSCSHNNIIIKRRPLADDLLRNINLRWSEIFFFIIVSSFVVYEILSEWSVGEEVVMFLPHWLNNTLGISGRLAGTIKALTLFVVTPTIIYSIFALLKKLIAQENLKRGFSQLVLAILPITASMHLLKALLKTTSRIPYWKFALSDTEGVKYATDIINNHELLQSNLLTNYISPSISYLAILFPLLGLLLSFYIIGKQDYTSKASKRISIIAIVLYGSLFITSIVGWRIIPMF